MPAMSVAELVRTTLPRGALALLLTATGAAGESAVSYYDQAMEEGLYGEAEAYAKLALESAIAEGLDKILALQLSLT